MATFEFVLPELGEGMEAGDVVQVLVTVGDSITEEQPVLELETDKAVVEVPAPVRGTVKAIHVQAGDKAVVGQLLLTVETPAATMALRREMLVASERNFPPRTYTISELLNIDCPAGQPVTFVLAKKRVVFRIRDRRRGLLRRLVRRWRRVPRPQPQCHSHLRGMVRIGPPRTMRCQGP